MPKWMFALCVVSMVACGGQEAGQAPEPAVEDLRDEVGVGPVPANPQRGGDPELGYKLLVNSAYVRCGIPKTLSDALPTGSTETVPGREGDNEGLPYFQTSFTTEDGVELVTTNCLTCHAGRINGELVIGLGDTQTDYTTNPLDLLETFGDAIDLVVTDPAERRELDDFIRRGEVIAPYSKTRVVGLNPAESITAGIFAHLDPETLTWSEEPILEVPAAYKEHVTALSVPPWWWMKKKHNMFYTTSGGKDHVAWAMLISTACADGVEETEEIAAYFPDILAYIRSIEPPPWPFEAPDAQEVAQGEEVFLDHCARCHGTYGEDWTYPNLAVSLDEVGTDPNLAHLMFDATVFHQWVEDSFFGTMGTPEPALAYIAPPLDGVWATPPFLHNSSVPTLEALLDSTQRPECWTWSYDTTDYDTEAVGWNFSETHCQSDEEDERQRSLIYDSNLFGHDNGGHTFGDHLSAEERSALIAYLKTL